MAGPWAHETLELKNTRGVPLYHMIFATDNEAGTAIMEHVYATALAEIRAMRHGLSAWSNPSAGSGRGWSS